MAGLITFCLMFLFLPLAKPLTVPDALTTVIHTIEQIIDFYQSDYNNLNVDGLFGLRVLEGHLIAIVQQQKTGNLSQVTPEIVSRLISLKGKASNICQAATKAVEKDDPKYFKMMKYVVGSPWDVFDPKRRHVDMVNAWSPITYKHAKETVKLDETVSDQCMAELIGSHRQNGTPCDISDKCVHIMATPGLVGYSITHQLLWTMLAEKTGCRTQLQKRLTETRRGTLETLREELCSNNYIQMLQVVDKSTHTVIAPTLQDIFLEQLFICPSLGFFEFLKLEYLPAIVSWQLKSGCYGKMQRSQQSATLNDPSLVGKFQDDYTDQDPNTPQKSLKDILAGVRIGAVNMDDPGHHNSRVLLSYDTGRYAGRQLLVEKVMTGGCLAHKTAVASGALVLYLRFLTESDAAKVFEASSQADKKHNTKLGGPWDLGKPAKILKSLADKAGNKSFDAGHSDGIQELHDNLMRHDADLNKLSAGVKREAVPAVADKVEKGMVKQANGEVGAGSVNKGVSLDKMDKNLVGDNMHKNENKLAAEDNNVLADQMHANQGDGDYDNEEEDGLGEDNTVVGNQRDENDNNADRHQLVKPLMKNVDETYDDAERPIKDNYAYEDDDEEEEDEDEDYDANERVEEHNADYDYDKNGHDIGNGNDVGQGHLNARNFGRQGVRQYDNNIFEDKEEKSLGLGPVKDYKYDDEEEEDDYEYDDDNDEMERRRKEEVRQDFGNPKIATSLGHQAGGIAHLKTGLNDGVSKTMMIFVAALSLCCVLLFYKFVRRRRLRIRINSNYFHI